MACVGVAQSNGAVDLAGSLPAQGAEFEHGEGVEVVIEWRFRFSGEAKARDAATVLRRPPQQQLWDSMRAIRPEAAACAKEQGFAGVLRLPVVVYPTGRVSWANVRTDNEAFRGCISKALKTLEFARTKAGFTFYYAYVFPQAAVAPKAPPTK